MFKKDMAAAPGAQKIKHAGKGSAVATMPNRKSITQVTHNPAATMNDYAKATPMAQPQPATPDGLGSGSWPGIGR
jgi:hypothetical protein